MAQPIWLISSLVALLLTSIVPVTPGSPQEPTAPQKISAPLHAQLRDGQPVSFLVLMSDQPDPDAILSDPALQGATSLERRTRLYEALTSFATEKQAPLQRWLTERSIHHRAFYIINAFEVVGDLQIASALAQRPDVDRIVANPEVRLSLPDQPVADPIESAQTSAELPYGIRYARAPEVWALGYTGQGITIASQDTGVLWTHPALQPRYRGWNAGSQSADHAYNWFDPFGSEGRPTSTCSQDPQVPCDDYGHGTHTVGTLVGRESGLPEEATTVGMAPDANWIGCRNMKNGNGTPASYTACFEFFLAPYPQGGDPRTQGDPARAPHIINNSWYCPPQEGCDFDSLQQVVETVRAAGQMIVASAGNSGPSCSTVMYPIGGYESVFSVGAHNGTGTVTGFSSRGPVTADGSGRLKPDLTAAGESVRSATLDGKYNSSSGTSMASPHVAGAIALLWSARPELVGDLVSTEQILYKSATPVASAVCKSVSSTSVPNNTYGYGRLNALAAVEMALKPSTLTATIAWSSGGRVANVDVVLIDDITGYRRTAMTDAEGDVQFEKLTPGRYRLEVELGDAYGEQLIVMQLGEKKSSLVRIHHYLHLPKVSQ